MRCLFYTCLFCLTTLFYPGCYAFSSHPSLDIYEEQCFVISLLEKINAWRETKGKKAFLLHLPLQNLATRYSQDMAQRGYFSHIDPEGRKPRDRILASGILAKNVGENLAQIKAGQWSVDDLLQAWLHSKSHRENLEESTFEKTGIGMQKDSLGNYYITQIFTSAK